MTTTTGERAAFPGLQEDGRTILRSLPFSDFVDLELRADTSGEGDGRTFEGIAVPYNREIDVDGWFYEVWEGSASSGPFDAQMNSAFRILVGHRHIMLGGDVVGRLTSMRNDAKGLRVEGRISDVPSGNTALTLMRDKALTELSIGFYRVPNGDSVTRDGDGRPHIKMTKARLFEVALEPWGAYGRGAAVSALRAQHAAEATKVDRDRVVIYLGGREVASVPLSADLRAAVAPVVDAPAAPASPVEAPEFLPELPATS
jgi:HK97 family phage prohead protease